MNFFFSHALTAVSHSVYSVSVHPVLFRHTLTMSLFVIALVIMDVSLFLSIIAEFF